MIQVLVWVLLAVAALIVGQAVGKWAFGAKQNLTKVRRAAQSLAISLREAGFKKIPEMLEQFTVGDLPDLLDGLQDLAKIMQSGNATILQELDGTFDRCLGAKLSSPEGRALIEAKLADARQVAGECLKAAAPIVAKAALTAALVA